MTEYGSGTCVRAFLNVRVKALIATNSQQERVRQEKRTRSCWLRVCVALHVRKTPRVKGPIELH